MARILIDLEENSVAACRWHRDGISELTSIEAGVIAEAVAEGTDIQGLIDMYVHEIEEMTADIKDERHRANNYLSGKVAALNQVIRDLKGEDG